MTHPLHHGRVWTVLPPSSAYRLSEAQMVPFQCNPQFARIPVSTCIDSLRPHGRQENGKTAAVSDVGIVRIALHAGRHNEAIWSREKKSNP